MAYTLTAEDIQRLGIVDAMPGEMATPEEEAMIRAGIPGGSTASEKRAVGLDPLDTYTPEEIAAASQPTLSELQTVQIQPSVMEPRSPYSTLRDIGMETDQASSITALLYPERFGAQPAATPEAAKTSAPAAALAAASAPAAAGGILSMMQPISADPFEGLSKTQRMILAFSAIQDAGAALQGRQGTAFNDAMAGFTEARDIERKRQAAAAELSARQQVLGALGASGLPANPTAEDIDAYAARLTSILATAPSMAPFVTAELARIQPMRERAVTSAAEMASGYQMIDLIDALKNDPALEGALGITGLVRGKAADLGLDAETARVKSRIDQIKGSVFLKAFEALKGGGQITELEGKKAEAAMGRLNTLTNKEDFVDALNEISFYINIGNRRKAGENIPPDTVYGGGAGAGSSSKMSDEDLLKKYGG
jgi:hypothetical protein